MFIKKHANNATKDLDAYDYRTNDGSGSKNTPKTYIKTTIESEDWDYISLQQNSGDSGKPDTYSPCLEYLIKYVTDLVSENFKIVFNMTWAYQQDSTHNEFSKYNGNQTKMYTAIVNAVDEKVVSNPDIDQVIPVITAI